MRAAARCLLGAGSANAAIACNRLRRGGSRLVSAARASQARSALHPRDTKPALDGAPGPSPADAPLRGAPTLEMGYNRLVSRFTRTTATHSLGANSNARRVRQVEWNVARLESALAQPECIRRHNELTSQNKRTGGRRYSGSVFHPFRTLRPAWQAGRVSPIGRRGTVWWAARRRHLCVPDRPFQRAAVERRSGR